MSIFIPVKARCAACGTEVHTRLAASVNADRRPDLRAAILDGTFQSMACTGCGAQVRLPAHLTYIDIARGQWILVEDTSELGRWREVEAEATKLYDVSFGAGAPPVAREMGADITPRLVFGWTALREKLIAQEAGMDDVALELMKISVLRNVPAPPFTGTSELRLIDVAEEEITLRWVDQITEEGIADLPMEREIYDDVAADQANWGALRTTIDTGLYVDMQRILMGAEVAA
jgi:hypothetical protein